MYVPNVPCGVERRNLSSLSLRKSKGVPNVPCGVESQLSGWKEHWGQVVPNVPCGVESKRDNPDLKGQGGLGS